MDKAVGIVEYLAAWLKELIWTFFNTQAWFEKVEGMLPKE